MKKTLRNLFFVTIALATLFALAISVSATDGETVTLLDENACGYVMKTTDGTTANDGSTNDFWWQIDSEGTLTISHKTQEGNDPSVELMANPATNWDLTANIPWVSYRSQVKKVVFDVDNSICIHSSPYLFWGLNNCTTVVLPESKIYFYSARIFAECYSLVTVGPEGTPTGTFDLRNIVGSCPTNGKMTNGNPFQDCAQDADVTVLMPLAESFSVAEAPCLGYIWDKSLKASIIAENFDIAKSVTFKVVPGSLGETIANSYAESYASTEGKCTVSKYAAGDWILTSGSGVTIQHGSEGWTVDWTYSLDVGLGGVLEVTWTDSTVSGTNTKRYTYRPNSTMTEIATNYGKYVKRVNFVGFNQFFEGWAGTLLTNKFTKLTTVDVGDVTHFRAGSASYWFNLPALTTFGSSTRGTLKEGVIDLTGMTFESGKTYNLFNGCSGAKELIVPDGNLIVSATTFSGMAALEKITLGKVTVSDGAFDGMTALQTIQLTDKTFTDDTTNKLLPVDNENLVVICYSKTTADSFTDYGKTKIVYFGDVITSEGFSVRTQKTANSSNGLRTLYTFNKTRRTEIEAAGLTFKEFGAIAVSKNRLGSSTVSLSWNGTEYVPNIANAVKVPVFVGSDDGDVQLGKILETSDDTNIDFALTLVNFKDNFTSDIYACGYAIFVDANGNEYIEYANYGDINADWEYVNIFELTMYLYTETDLMNDIVADEEPVWGILGTEAVAVTDASVYEITLDDGNTSMMIVTDAEGGYNLLVRSLDSAKTADLDAAEAKAAALGYTTLASSKVIKITEDPDFAVKPDWQLYVDAKLEAASLSSTEKSKTFIFVTDNHWDVNTKNNSSVTFSTDVMKYVSEQLGDAAVVYGGDPYAGYYEAYDENDPYANINTALSVIDDYIIGQIKENFGTNFFYALGNHDSNVVGYRKVMDSVDNGGLGYDQETAMEYYLISDKDMYDHSVGVFADKGIVFDTEGIESFKKVLEDNGITDETTLSEAEYMMKMHYHYDDTAAKVRYVVLDTGGCGRTQMGVFKGGWNNMFLCQYKWFANTLKSTPEGYDVVVIGHQIVETKAEYSDGDADFSTLMGVIYDIITAYKTGAEYKAENLVTDWQKENYGEIFTQVAEACGTVDIDFESPFEGTVFTIGGHVHSDNGWYVNNGGQITDVQFGDEGAEVADGAVLAISTGTARNYNTSPAVDGYTMGSSFPNNFRFDVVTIKDDGSVLVTRIGAGNNRYYAYAG